jgi:DNA-binding CsgD family transcriptional regulator
MGTDYFEIAGPQDRRLAGLEGERFTVGKSENASLRLSDGGVSRLHAVVERLGSGWSIRDLDSTNGTWVNGRRIAAEHPLRNGDDIRLGETRLVFRSATNDADPATHAGPTPPVLTPRERDVLAELCRPLASGDVFTEPASIRDIARALVVTEAAVKHHLVRMYDKFDIFDTDQRRRVRLANEALTRGAINLSELSP